MSSPASQPHCESWGQEPGLLPSSLTGPDQGLAQGMSAAEMDRYKDGGGSGYQGNGTPDDGWGGTVSHLLECLCLPLPHPASAWPP